MVLEKWSFGFKLRLSNYCSGTEKHKVYALSLYQARASLHSPHGLSQQLTAFVSIHIHIHITLGICSSTEGHLQPE